MFSKLFGRDKGAPDEVPPESQPGATPQPRQSQASIDDALGDETIRSWIPRLARRDWQDFPAFLAGLPSQERSFCSRTIALAFRGEYPEWVDAWVDDDPSNALARQFRGDVLMTLGWERRGGRSADKTQEAQFEAFFEALAAAREDLEAAAELAPEDAGPFGSLIDVAKGLQAPREVVDELYAEAQRRERWAMQPAWSMAQYLAPQWYGSVEEMVAFARSTSEAAPAGLPIHVVLPEAHIEAWLSETRGDGWWKRPGVGNEILAAAAKSIDGPNATGPWERRNRSAFAFCYYKLGMKDRLRPEMARIGASVMYPWVLLRSPENEFKVARRAAGLSFSRVEPDEA